MTHLLSCKNVISIEHVIVAVFVGLASLNGFIKKYIILCLQIFSAEKINYLQSLSLVFILKMILKI